MPQECPRFSRFKTFCPKTFMLCYSGHTLFLKFNFLAMWLVWVLIVLIHMYTLFQVTTQEWALD